MDLTMQIVKSVLVEENNRDLSHNFLISPLSLTTMLTMVASGHKGEAFEKLMSLLGLKSYADLLYESNRLMSLASSNTENGLVILSSVNGVWVDKSFKLNPSFNQLAKSIFKAHSSTLDFKNKLKEAITEINEWGEKATRGMIKESFPAEYAKRDDTVIVLANALYFKAAWLSQFNAWHTSTDKFHTLGGNTVLVPFLRSNCQVYLYGSYHGSKVLRLPYKYNKYAMYFFLPDKKDGVYDLLEQFSSDSALINLQLELKMVRLNNLVIPKFKFRYGVEVTKMMEKLGVVLDIKDSEMLEDVGNKDEIESMRTFHGCCIEVDECGTEAAATTFYLRGGGGPPPDEPPDEFIADHPFVFMIREDSSKTPIFLGVVVNPLLQ